VAPRALSAVVIALGLAALVVLARRASLPPTLPPCPSSDAVVFVDTRTRVLLACEGGQVAHAYRVRLGSAGVGKTREGDRRTPLGAYPLGPPRDSERFGTFVPVGYPTPAQAQRGFTGSAIGVHGPPRALLALGPYLNAFDTTAGCIGLATDAEMRELRAWIADRGVDRIELR
jgi:hypothetical protein